MESRVFLLIILLNCLSITAQKFAIPYGKINLDFYYSSRDHPVKGQRISVMTQPVLTVCVNNSYILKSETIDGRTFVIRAINCMRFGHIENFCGNQFESSYMSLDQILLTDHHVLRIENKTPFFKNCLHYLYLNPSLNGHEVNLTYVLVDYHIDDLNKPKDPYDYPLSKTSLFGIIFLSACIVLVFVLCIGWFGLIYYRRFAHYRMKKQLRKALTQSTEQMLQKSPVIIFDPNDKNNEHIDDDPMCAICLESFKAKEKLRKLVCSHYFHVTCIDPWLLSRQSCPLCNRNILRHSIPSISSSIMAAINEHNEESTTIANNNQTNQAQNLNV